MLTIHNKIEPMAKRRADILQLLDQAGREGSDIVLLPERADHHRTLEASAAHRSGKFGVRETLGLTLDSPWLQQVAALARKHKMVIIPSIIHNDGDMTFGAAPVYGPDGSLLGCYNKTHLAPGEERIFDTGTHLDPITTAFGKLGIFICWDIHFPEVTRVYELKGADILLWSTMRQGPWEREWFQTVLPARCLTHGMPLGVATFAEDEQLNKRFAMNSAIFDSFGQIVAGGNRGESGLVRATIDLDLRPVINREWDNPEFVDYPKYVARHRRPDLYSVLTAPIPAGNAVKPGPYLGPKRAADS
jgi:predicted amidohydrolase